MSQEKLQQRLEQVSNITYENNLAKVEKLRGLFHYKRNYFLTRINDTYTKNTQKIKKFHCLLSC